MEAPKACLEFYNFTYRKIYCASEGDEFLCNIGPDMNLVLKDKRFKTRYLHSLLPLSEDIRYRYLASLKRVLLSTLAHASTTCKVPDAVHSKLVGGCMNDKDDNSDVMEAGSWVRSFSAACLIGLPLSRMGRMS